MGDWQPRPPMRRDEHGRLPGDLGAPEMIDVMPDPKPAKARKASPAEWRRIRAEKVTGKPCRGCGVVAQVVSAHHLVGGNHREDVPENIVPMCGTGTMGCHGVYTTRAPAGQTMLGKIAGEWVDPHMVTFEQVAANLRASLQDDERAYALGRLGDLGFERRFPRRPHAVATERTDDDAA